MSARSPATPAPGKAWRFVQHSFEPFAKPRGACVLDDAGTRHVKAVTGRCQLCSTIGKCCNDRVESTVTNQFMLAAAGHKQNVTGLHWPALKDCRIAAAQEHREGRHVWRRRKTLLKFAIG